jgi:UDP-N-acetylglucosamine pyrophosphorylase
MFKIDVLSNGKYLFEIMAENLNRANKKHGVVIPWYIMTSKENSKGTAEFLKEHNYFGYPESHVCLFEQEKLPVLDENGKLLLNEDMQINEAANGNGGIFNSMLKKGVFVDMEKRGVEWIFVGGVDNILLQLVDLPLIGLCINDNNLVGVKTILRDSPKEKVGVFCKQNGKVKVIEYTEIPEEVAIKVNSHGELIFGESNIVAHLFNIKALKKASTKELHYHVAFKRTTYINEQGELIRPTTPNCYKFEKFIFDAFALFDNVSILRGKREEDFAPIKNSTRNRQSGNCENII